VSEDELVRAVVEMSALELYEREGRDYAKYIDSVVAYGLLAGQLGSRAAGELADKSIEMLQAMQIYMGRAYGYQDPRYRAITAAVDSFTSGRLEILRKMRDAGIPVYVIKAIARNYGAQVASGCIEGWAVEKIDEYLSPVHGEKRWYKKLLGILEESKCRD